jgi:hypothetical protein
MKPTPTQQIEKLDALKRLAADPAFQEHVQKPMDAMVAEAHAELLDVKVNGTALEAARARYAVALAVSRLLPEKLAAVEASVKRAQAENA